MTTVTPPQSRQAPPTGTGVQVNTTALILAASKGLEAMPVGQTLDATIAQLKPGGVVLVDTALGQLTLQATMSLAKGAALTLTLTQLEPPTAQITSVGGKPVHAGGQTSAQATQSAPTLPSLHVGQNVTATLLRPAQGFAQSAPGTPGAGPSTPTAAAAQNAVPSAGPVAIPPATPAATSPAPPAIPQGTVPGSSPTTPPGTTPGTHPGATQGQASSSSTPSTPTVASQGLTQGQAAQQGQATTLPSGTRFNATVQKIDAPTASISAAAGKVTGQPGAQPLAQGQLISGAVTGRLAGGQPILQTPAATFALGAGGQLGEGAKISLRLDSGPLPPSTNAPSLGLKAAGGASELIGAKSWGDLGEALKALAGADAQRLQHVAQRGLPQAGAKLTSQMVFFLSALKGGDIRALFGDTAARVLDNERPGLLAKMGGDFQAMARLADEPQSGDWRLALIPFWDGEKLEQLRMFWRGGGQGDEADDSEETRFVLDVDLSNLGHLQIDGLIKDNRRHLDIIVRTDEPLAQEMRADITEMAQVTRETTGLGVHVAFQAKPANFQPLPEPKQAEQNIPVSGLGTGLIA